jgi:hypothetical protein
MKKPLFVLAFLLVVPELFLSALLADVIHFKDGRKLEGKILEETDASVRIKTPYGEVTVERKQILKIDYVTSDEDVFREMVEKLDKTDADALFKLAMWCKEHKKKRDYRKYLKAALAADRGHDDANQEAGNVKYDGKWFTPVELEKYKKEEAERMKAKGYVLYEGEWIPEVEMKKREGFVEWEGEWITKMEQYRRMGERDIEKYFGYPMTITDSEHFTIRSKGSEVFHRELLDFCELEFEHFVRTFEPDDVEMKMLTFYPIPIYILESLGTSEKFVLSGYIKRYTPPLQDPDEYEPEANFSLYFPRPLIVLTEGGHLVGEDLQASQIGYLTHHLGHLLIRRFKRGGEVPGWIETGVAHYYEGVTNFHQTLSVCSFQGYERGLKWDKGWQNFVDWKKKLIDSDHHGQLPPLDHLFYRTIERMSSREMAKAWSLTTFLLHHHKKEFLEFIRRSLAPYKGIKSLPQEEAWKLAFDETTTQDIEEAWEQWIVQQPQMFSRDDKLKLD